MTRDTSGVVAAIRAAFGDSPHPGTEQIVPPGLQSDEAREVAWKYARVSWQDVSREMLGHTADDLCFMTPAAFVYFLPRFLIDVLEHYDDPDSAIPEDVIFQLTRQPDSHAFDSRVALMGDAEKRAVGSFLSLVKKMAEADGSYIASRTDEAIASAWHQFIEI